MRAALASSIGQPKLMTALRWISCLRWCTRLLSVFRAVYGGIEHIECNATVGDKRFIPLGKARLVPVVRGLLKMYNAPANYNETVNTLGKPFYAKSEPRKMGKGWDLEAQANPLALCLAPGALVELEA